MSLTPFSGERPGFINMNQARSLPVEQDSYRLCCGIGIQPAPAAAILLSDQGGIYERIVKVPVFDPGAADEHVPRPAVPLPGSCPAHFLEASRSLMCNKR